MDVCNISTENLGDKQLYLCEVLTKTIFGLQPARRILKCSVSERKDELF